MVVINGVEYLLNHEARVCFGFSPKTNGQAFKKIVEQTGIRVRQVPGTRILYLKEDVLRVANETTQLSRPIPA